MDLIENKDYYINDDGQFVFTGHYLLKRGYCCGNGCLHCPYKYENVPFERRQELLKARALRNQSTKKKRS